MRRAQRGGPDLLLLGEVALRLRMPLWKLQDAFRRGLLAPPLKAGRYRVVPADRLPEIEAALRAAGRLPEQGRAG